MKDDMRCIRAKGEGVWEVRVHVSRDPVTGKVKQVSHTVRGPISAARTERSVIEAAVARGEYGGRQSTFGQLLTEWNDHRESIGRAKQTISGSRERVARDIMEGLGHLQLDKISALDIDRFYRKLRDDGRGPSVLMTLHLDIVGALNQGRKWGYLPNDITGNITAPKLAQREKTVPTREEVAQLIAAARKGDGKPRSASPFMAGMITFASRSGLRLGEMCALRFSAVDMATRMVDVRLSIWETGSKSQNDLQWGSKLPKSGKSRRFRLDPTPIVVIRQRYDQLVENARQLERPVPDDGYVWAAGPLGQVPMMPSVVSNRFAKLKKRENIACRFHDLRTFHATELIALGVDPRTVADRLGHSNTALTMRLYTAGRPEQDDAAAKLLGDSLGPVPGFDVPAPPALSA